MSQKALYGVIEESLLALKYGMCPACEEYGAKHLKPKLQLYRNKTRKVIEVSLDGQEWWVIKWEKKP